MFLVSTHIYHNVHNDWADSLATSDHPDVQEKIKRVIEQGHIDLEDFKGVRSGNDLSLCNAIGI